LVSRYFIIRIYGLARKTSIGIGSSGRVGSPHINLSCSAINFSANNCSALGLYAFSSAINRSFSSCSANNSSAIFCSTAFFSAAVFSAARAFLIFLLSTVGSITSLGVTTFIAGLLCFFYNLLLFH
jgi:hypothetical protein